MIIRLLNDNLRNKLIRKLRRAWQSLVERRYYLVEYWA